MALKFTASNWNNYDSVRVGLDPSEGTGLVEVLSDPDKNGVFKITNKATQKFVVEARKGATIVRKEYSLSGLELTEPASIVSAVFEPENGENFEGWSTEEYSRSNISQNIEEFSDNTILATGNYSGTISGDFSSYTTGTTTYNCIYMPVKQDVIDYLTQLTPADKTLRRIKATNEKYDSNNTKIGATVTGNYSVDDQTALEKLKKLYVAVPTNAAELRIALTARYSDNTESDPIFITYNVGGMRSLS